MTKAEARAKARALWRRVGRRRAAHNGRPHGARAVCPPRMAAGRVGVLLCADARRAGPVAVLEAALREGKRLAVPRTANGRMEGRAAAPP